MEVYLNKNVYNCTPENIKLCSEEIRKSNLVIFPTETVYGLGACALSEEAVKKIFTAKKRPQNNPLIVHVLNWSEASIYTNVTNNEEKIIKTLVKDFWPGPLTLLVKKNQFLSDMVTAGSEWVAIRSPSDKNARLLLEHAMVPIAAPSANRSGKITSTSKEHIMSYFGDSEISILLDNKPSTYGTESTILKIDNNSLTIMRPGFITIEMVKKSLKDIANLDISHKEYQTQTNSPGTSLSHYTTSKNTVMFNFIDVDLGYNNEFENMQHALKEYFDNSACIDFGKKNLHNQHLFAAYVDLSSNMDIQEAIFNFYNILFELDKLEIKNILIFDFFADKEGLCRTLYDRMFRCCSGKKMLIPLSIVLAQSS